MKKTLLILVSIAFVNILFFNEAKAALTPPSIDSCIKCDSVTKKVEVTWWNYGRTAGTTYVKINSSLINVGDSTSYTYQGSNGGDYNVSVIYREGAEEAESAVKFSSCHSCLGTIPTNAHLCGNICINDDKNVTVDTTRRLVGIRDNCTTARKCEYYCDDDEVVSGSTCVPAVTAPTVTLSRNLSSIYLGDPVRLTWQVSGDATSCTASSTSGGNWSGSKSYSNGTYSNNVYPTSTGTKTYTITCSNAGGSDSDSVNVTVNAVPNVAPTANISNPSGSRTITAGDSVWFSSSGSSDSDGSITNYEWRQGTCTGTLLSTSSSFTRNFSSSGSYRIYLRVRDNDGAWSTNCPSRLITVNSNNPPVTSITNPSSDITVLEGSSVTFSGTGSDSDGTIAGYDWRQGSCTGTLISSSNLTTPTINLSIHFNTVGSYRIYLRARDNDGAWSTNCPSRLVTVTEFCSGNSPCEPPNLSDVCTNGNVTIGWSPVVGADRYTLEIKSADNPYPTLFTTTTTGTSYTWNGGENGKVYYYGVVALKPGDPIQYYVPDPSPVVSCNASPTAYIDQPLTDQTIGVGTSISFAGHGTDTDGTIKSGGYDWRMGNCNTGTLLTHWTSFPYTFNTAGTYTIYLRVQDNDNAWSTNCPSRTITVNNYSCTDIPNATICPSDGVGLTEATSSTVVEDGNCSSPDGSIPKCQYTCDSPYVKMGNVCIEPTCLSADDITNAELCPGDEAVSSGEFRDVVSNCSSPDGSSPKCEYTCKEDYRYDSDSDTCELISDSRPVNWQEINP